MKDIVVIGKVAKLSKDIKHSNYYYKYPTSSTRSSHPGKQAVGASRTIQDFVSDEIKENTQGTMDASRNNAARAAAAFMTSQTSRATDASGSPQSERSTQTVADKVFSMVEQLKLLEL